MKKYTGVKYILSDIKMPDNKLEPFNADDRYYITHKRFCYICNRACSIKYNMKVCDVCEELI